MAQRKRVKTRYSVEAERMTEEALDALLKEMAREAFGGNDTNGVTWHSRGPFVATTDGDRKFLYCAYDGESGCPFRIKVLHEGEHRMLWMFKQSKTRPTCTLRRRTILRLSLRLAPRPQRQQPFKGAAPSHQGPL